MGDINYDDSVARVKTLIGMTTAEENVVYNYDNFPDFDYSNILEESQARTRLPESFSTYSEQSSLSSINFTAIKKTNNKQKEVEHTDELCVFKCWLGLWASLLNAQPSEEWMVKIKNF